MMRLDIELKMNSFGSCEKRFFCFVLNIFYIVISWVLVLGLEFLTCSYIKYHKR